MEMLVFDWKSREIPWEMLVFWFFIGTSMNITWVCWENHQEKLREWVIFQQTRVWLLEDDSRGVGGHENGWVHVTNGDRTKQDGSCFRIGRHRWSSRTCHCNSNWFRHPSDDISILHAGGLTHFTSFRKHHRRLLTLNGYTHVSCTPKPYQSSSFAGDAPAATCNEMKTTRGGVRSQLLEALEFFCINTWSSWKESGPSQNKETRA